MSAFYELDLSSTINQELARLDPDITPRKVFSHLSYARSSLSEPRSPPKQRPLWNKLSEQKDRFIETLGSISRLLPEKTAPKGKSLPFLIRSFSSPFFSKSFQPPRYFSKGADESNRKLHPPPIPYLLEESDEMAISYPSTEIKKFITKHLSRKGKLSQNTRGFVFVELEDGYIEDLLPFVPDKQAEAAPYLGIYSKPDSPHIPVILVSEKIARELGEIREIGEEILFEILGLHSTSPAHWPKIEKVWFLTVQSSRLEEIRERYRLPARIGSHDFAIAIGVVYADKKKKKKPATMRINPAYLAA